jgi:hypothetical protein
LLLRTMTKKHRPRKRTVRRTRSEKTRIDVTND